MERNRVAPVLHGQPLRRHRPAPRRCANCSYFTPKSAHCGTCRGPSHIAYAGKSRTMTLGVLVTVNELCRDWKTVCDQ